jgi:hypothetical protein
MRFSFISTSTQQPTDHKIRYYKYLMPQTKLLSDQVWFSVHRPVMLLVCLVSIVSFIVILAELDWKWVSPAYRPLSFAHSVFGALTIGLCILQVSPLSLSHSFNLINFYLSLLFTLTRKVIMGILRPSSQSSMRRIFNYSHRVMGIITFFFSGSDLKH